jgi:hypothetical protein
VRVLVCAADRHGSTAEIAARIAAAVRAGLSRDAVVDVLGSASWPAGCAHGRSS